MLLSLWLLGALVGCYESNEHQEEDCYVATPADSGVSAACSPSGAAASLLYNAAGAEPCGTIVSVDDGPADGGLSASGASCCYLVTWQSAVCADLGL